MRAGFARIAPNRVAFVAAATSFVLSGAYALRLGTSIRYWDEQVYVTLAHNVAAGFGYTQLNTGPTAYRPPGYPLLLAVLDFVGVGVTGFHLFNAFLMAATVYLVFLLGSRLYSPTAGAVAAVIASVYPLFLYTAGTIYPQTMAGCLLVGGLLLVTRIERPDGSISLRTAVVAGATWGLLVLSVPTFGASLLAAAVYLTYRLRSRAIRPVAVLLIAAAILPGTWCVRNAVQLHAFIPVSTNNGINLLQGNSENATSGGGRLVDTSQYEKPVEALDPTEVEVERIYRGQAIEWIRTHPRRAVTLYFGKVLNHFNYHNDYATSGQSSVVKDLVSALSFYPLLFLAAIRLMYVVRGRARPFEALLLSLVVGNAFVLAVFYTRLRFRIPLDTLVIIVAAGAITDMARRWVDGRTGSPDADPVLAARSPALPHR